jgi:hypothetical protein
VTEIIPPFAESVKEAENRLSQILNGHCKIAVHHKLAEDLMGIIEAIDHEKFSRELWYSRDELDSRMKKKGFLCLTAILDGKTIAFDYGYEDDEEDTFFSDNTATLVEGKGVGLTLFALEIIHSHKLGYKYTKLSAEEVDAQGRNLPLIWGRLGFKTVSAHPSKGVEMKLTHTPQAIRSIFDNYISDKSTSK